MPYVEEVRETMWWLRALGFTMRGCSSSSRKVEETQPIIGLTKRRKRQRRRLSRGQSHWRVILKREKERNSKLFEVLKNN